MTELSQVPSEIILNIFSHLHPSTLINFTCLCKRHYALSTKFLKKHKEHQDHYHRVSDRFSSTVPTVLNEILLDSRLAWYIKRLVIYNQRRSFEDWERYDGKDSEDRDVIAGRMEHWQSFYSSEDLQLYRDALQWLPMKGTEPLIGQLERGGDAPLKLLLVYLANDLDTVVVTNHDCAGYDDFFVEHLSEMLRTIAVMPKQGRPDYFRSLSKVYLNHCLESRDFMHTVKLSVRSLAPFLTLPSLNTLEVGIGGNEDDHGYEWEFGPDFSTAKHLDLGIMVLTPAEATGFLGVTQNLKSFSWGSSAGLHLGLHRNHEALKLLLRNSANTLETIDIGWCDTQYPLTMLRGFKVLKNITLDVYHLFPRKMWLESEQLAPQTKSPTMESHWPIGLSSIVPASIERLKITRSRRLPRYLYPSQVDILVSGLSDFVRAKSQVSSNLQGICARHLWMLSETTSLVPFTSQKLEEACEAAGIAFSDCYEKPCKVCEARAAVLGEGLDRSNGFQC